MHSILTRTLPARTSCRCFSCGRASKSTIVRRNVNATTKRRKIGANDVFTACYSSLMASAVIADAEIKKDRRKKWERAIEDARGGQGQEVVEEEAGEKTYSKIRARGTAEVKNGQQDVPLWTVDGISRGDLSNVSMMQTENRLEAWDRRIRQNLKASEVSEAEPLSGDSLLSSKNEELMTEEDEGDHIEWANEKPIPGIPLRDYARRQHVDVAEVSTKHLVKKILKHIPMYSDPEQVSEKDERYKIQLVLDAIAKLEGGFSKFPNYQFRHAKAYDGTRKELHTSFYKICQRDAQSQHDIDWMLAKLCYNLLVCPVPPSIITLNILLGGLHRHQQHDVAEHVIQTFFEGTRYAPTFDTLQLILDHYVAKNDRESFQFMFNRMRGTAMIERDGKKYYPDMRLGRRKTSSLNEPIIQRWATQHKFVVRDGHMIRRAPRDRAVFNSLINGSLAFGNTRQAVRIFGDASHHIRVQPEWITSIATRLLATLDHGGARTFFRYLIRYWKEADGSTFVKLTSEVRLAIHQIMALIGVDFSNSAALFPKMHFFGMYEKEAHAMLLDVYLEAAKEQIERIGKAIESLSLQLSSPPVEPVFDIEEAHEEALREYAAEDMQLDIIRPALRAGQIHCICNRVQHSVKRSREMRVEISEALQHMTSYSLSTPPVLLLNKVDSVPANKVLSTAPGTETRQKAPKHASIQHDKVEDAVADVQIAIVAPKMVEKRHTQPTTRQQEKSKSAKVGVHVLPRYELYTPSEHYAATAAAM